MGGDSSDPLHVQQQLTAAKIWKGEMTLGSRMLRKVCVAGCFCCCVKWRMRCGAAAARAIDYLPAAARVWWQRRGEWVVKHGSPVAGVLNSFRDIHFVTIFKSIEVWG